MFQQVLLSQWRWAALVVTGLGAAAIALPMLAVGGMPSDAAGILDHVHTRGFMFPVLAVLTGLLLGMSAWAADHRGGHVYALSLPVPRWYYTLLRYGAGVVLVLPIAFAAWLGALIATSGLALPEGLYSYAGALGARFLLGVLLVYSVVFAISSGTNRTAGWIMASFAGLLFGHALTSLFSDANLLEMFGNLVIFPLISSGGPLSVFSGSWLVVGL